MLEPDYLVARSEDTDPVTFASRIYFAGFTLFSLGVGDYFFRPDAVGMLLMTIICTFQGVFLVIVSVGCMVISP